MISSLVFIIRESAINCQCREVFLDKSNLVGYNLNVTTAFMVFEAALGSTPKSEDQRR